MLDVGLAAGLEYMGIRCRPVLYAEREAYAAAVLLARMEEGSLDAAPVWCGDFTQLDGRQFRGVVDCVVAGFPCQDLSIAGKRAGLDGERSGLFFEVLRFARDCGARWLFLENVSAIASAPASVMDGAEELEERAAARVMGELADCGWDAEWLTLSASDVGASHKRERWFCLAWKNLDDAGCGALRHDGKDKRPAAGEVNETSGAGGLLGNAGLQRIDLQQWPDGAEYPGTGGELVNAIGNRWGTRGIPDRNDDRNFTPSTGEIAVVNPECARWPQTGGGYSFTGGGRRHMDQLPNFVAYSPLAPQMDNGEKLSADSPSSPRRQPLTFAERLCITQRIMQPMDSLIEEMERYGTVDTIRGRIVVHDSEKQEWYELLPAMRGFLDVFEIWARRHGAVLETTGLRQLASRLEYSAPVTQLELDAAKRDLNQIRRILQRADLHTLQEAIRDADIKIAIENREG